MNILNSKCWCFEEIMSSITNHEYLLYYLQISSAANLGQICLIAVTRTYVFQNTKKEKDTPCDTKLLHFGPSVG